MTPIVEPVPGRSRSGVLLSIVTAFYNEERAIPQFFAEIEAVAASLPCAVEFVCVNDGSRDNTLALLRARLAGTPRMRVIDLSRNFGKEAAISAGLAEARGDAVVVIDADLQDPPSLIAAFLEKWREGYDVVYGARSSRGTDSFVKRRTAQMFYALFNRLASVSIPQDAGDFRLLDRKVVDALLSLPERNRFMKGLFTWVGFKQIGVEFPRGVRVAGKSGWSYPRLFDFAIDGLTSFSVLPLRLASLIGFIASMAGLLYAFYLVVRTIMLGIDVPGYASIMVVMMFLGGIQLISLGVIGEYLGRLYIEAKARPLYVVAGRYESDAADQPKAQL